MLTACQVFRGVDTQATLQVENRAYATEVLALEQTAQVRRAAIDITAQAAATQVAVVDIVNRQLLATVRAGETRVPSIQSDVVANATPGVASEQPTSVGTQTQFVDIGTAATVRESDGCAAGLQTQFSPDTQRIYVTARALNIKQGTEMSVEWLYNGQKIAEDRFSVSRDDDDFCLWFYIDAADVTFSPGEWSVRLLANGTPIDPATSFRILEAMTSQ